MSEIITVQDLETLKKHEIFEAEVLTGKVGGLASGANIDYATNQATGQVQKTMPAILRDIGFKPGSGDFTTGFTVLPGQRDYAWYDPVSHSWYSFLGTIPPTGFVVAPGTNPVGDANWKPTIDQFFIQSGAGAIYRPTLDKMREFVSVMDFDVKGDGSDETAKLQNALNAAAGKVLQFEAGKTYRYTDLIINDNTTIISNGAVFSRIAASSNPGFRINNGIYIDTLRIVTPGGAGGDKAVKIQGSNVSIGILSITAAAQGVYNSFNLAVDIISNPAGTVLSNISIGYFYCKYFTTAIFINNVTHMTVNKSLVEYYRTAYYLQDVANSEFSNVVCQLTSAASYGTNGENGLLIGSTLGSGTSHDLTFNNWSVANSGEHAYRLGGDYTIRNVWFNGCRSRLSGSSIVVNNPAATAWTGGCGFKILGGTTIDNERHENIFLNGCVVQDIEQSFGAFPGGHGVINFTPYMVVSANNVHLVDCIIEKILTPYSCRYGLITAACDGLTISNPTFRDCSDTVIKPLEDDVTEGHPFEQEPVTNFTITGGILEITAPSGGIPFYFSDLATQHHRNWNMSGTLIKGGASAVRIEPPSTGSLTNINLDFTYVDSNENDSTYTAPVVIGADEALLDVKAPWRPLAFAPVAVDGSIWQDTLGGKVYQKTNGLWKAGIAVHRATIADDSFATVVPPADFGSGFLLITGTGINRHMMAWFRATAAPSSTKYFGAATALIVNTALTGTTGTDGNTTVGVQDKLIYIENRTGGSDTFSITFM